MRDNPGSRTATIREHFDMRADEYTKRSTWATDGETLDQLLALLPNLGSGRVLDLGSGPGFIGARMREVGLSQPVEIDLSHSMLAAAKGPMRVQADGHQLPFGDNTFAAVLCRQAVHYLSKPVAAYREVRRVLNAGGAFLIAQIVPFEDEADISWWSDVVSKRQPLRCHATTRGDLVQDLEAAGFHVTGITQVLGRSSVRSWAARYEGSHNLMDLFERAPNRVAALRSFVVTDQDISYTIRWVHVTAYVADDVDAPGLEV